MKRYLRVQKSLSAGHLSSVGIPEGDALSVLVATLFGAIWCKAIRSGDGGAAVPTAYIDNLDVVARTGRELEHACEVISQLERTWGLAFDLKKVLVLGSRLQNGGEAIHSDGKTPMGKESWCCDDV